MGMDDGFLQFIVGSFQGAHGAPPAPWDGPPREIVTVGRLANYVHADVFDRHFAYLGFSFEGTPPEWRRDYADSTLSQTFGGAAVRSMDVSDYEGCDIVADMNAPLDPALIQSADAVIDGGVIEHVFNAAQALRNYMAMLRVGGDLFIGTICNNHAGHGFYQFSPEFFFAALGPDFGFETPTVVLKAHPGPSGELGRGRFYAVTEPAKLGRRVGLVSREPVMILVHARKIAHIDPASMPAPIQSDYRVKHAAAVRSRGGRRRHLWPRFLKKIGKALPREGRDRLTAAAQRYEYALGNRDYYRPWQPPY